MNHISTVRQHLLDQMQALRNAASPEAVKVELERAKGISELAQVCVNTAKVEVDYLVATDQTSTPFLEVKPDASVAHLGNTPSGYTQGEVSRFPGVTQHRLRG